jgi:mRNA interferase YafQ
MAEDMKSLRYSGAFRKDFKRISRRGYRLEKLEAIIDALRTGVPLPAAARPHELKGVWKNYHECHIEPDWLLIYRVTEKEVLLARSGTHADLFEK